MGNNGSKSTRTRVHHYPVDESDVHVRREEVRRYLMDKESIIYGDYGEPLPYAGYTEGNPAFFYPPPVPLSRSQSEHNIVYIDKTRRSKPKSTISKKLSRWMKRIGGSKKERAYNRSQRRAQSELQYSDYHDSDQPHRELQLRHRMLSKSDSGLDNDFDNRSDDTYQELEMANLTRRYGSCDVFREGNNAQAELVFGSDGQPLHRFTPNRPSPALPNRQWSNRRYRPGTCRSEPTPRTGLQMGQTYQIPVGTRNTPGYYSHHSVPGHYREGAKAGYQGDEQQTYLKQPYTAPALPSPPTAQPSSTHFIHPEWHFPPPSPQAGLHTVAESEPSMEIYNSTVDRKVNSPTLNNKSLFIANRGKSASTGCLSQADSGVGQDWVEHEKSMDFDDDGGGMLTMASSYERIADMRREFPQRESKY